MALQLYVRCIKSKSEYSLVKVLFSFMFIIVAVHAELAWESNIVNALPGYPGPLPFKLETGYIGVGENEEQQYFYYFVESERDPGTDPVLFWITGGPGCTGFLGFVVQFGPLRFADSSHNGSLPSFELNPYSWTKIASIIFVDSPSGTGFSYANTPEAYRSADTLSAEGNHMFLRKWLLNHPSFSKNRMYVGGHSYGGKVVPMVVLEIAKGNKAGLEPWIPLQGYLIGNSLTDVEQDHNERFSYAHQVALISDEYFESYVKQLLTPPLEWSCTKKPLQRIITYNLQLAQSSCEGKFYNPDPSNALCLRAIELFEECTKNINLGHILYPKCDSTPPATDGRIRARATLEDGPDIFFFPSRLQDTLCYNDEMVMRAWANDQTVQKALHVRKGKKKEWVRCNKTLEAHYDADVSNVVPYHQILNEEGYQMLAYSGDHDMIVPHTRTLKWIRGFNLTVDEQWRPWTVDGQVAGYTVKYKNKEAYITFATIKGGSHTPPDDMPKECFAMVNRWFSSIPL